jgi:hypothetical protein
MQREVSAETLAATNTKSALPGETSCRLVGREGEEAHSPMEASWPLGSAPWDVQDLTAAETC